MTITTPTTIKKTGRTELTMSDSEPPTIEDSFLENNDRPIKLIAEFKRSRSKIGVEKEVKGIAEEMREDAYAIQDVRMDDGVTPFAVIELPMTNVTFEEVNMVDEKLQDITGYEGLTISNVDVGGITRLSQKR